MPIIEVNHVTKEFRLGALHGMKQTMLNTVARLRGHPVQPRPLFKALDDVDFKVDQGEVLGIIGHNGAGKSTLLKMLANISKPTRGSVRVKGKVAPLIEVGAGLVGDLTGRENIFLNGAILGIPKAEIKKKFDDIVAFAELEEFIDTPIKRYSSGMQVRLGFSIATSVESDILIVDEVLAVGDLAFQRKCFDRIEEMIKRQEKTVLLVSHNIRQVERLCSRVLLLDHGHLKMSGGPRAVCNHFYEINDKKIQTQSASRVHSGRAMTSGEIELTAIKLLDGNGNVTVSIEHGGAASVVMTFQVNQCISKPIFGVGLHTTDFVYLTTNHNDPMLSPESLLPGTYNVIFKIENMPFLPGTYSIRVGIATGEHQHTSFYLENALIFTVKADNLSRAHPDVAEGFISINGKWSLPASTTNHIRRVTANP